MQLREIIIEKIKTDGPISFHTFMDMCLYYPNLGYYTSSGEKFGSGGDYYTTSSLTPLFGALMGKQIEEMWAILGRKPFTIVEYGAGNGLLCRDIIEYLSQNSALYEHLHYAIIEKSPAMRLRQQRHLPDKVRWFESILDTGGITGCILSNEVVDNFPVHCVVMQDELMEVFVGYDNGFIEILQKAPPECAGYFDALGVDLPKRFRTEINLDALQWSRDIANNLQKGFVVTVDYGHRSDDLYKECRGNGTLLCFDKHNAHTAFFENIGGQDITAHVNFSALEHWGNQYGLETCGLTTQPRFLLALGLMDYLNKPHCQNGDLPKAIKNTALLKHLLLFDMDKFKVLIQRKAVPEQPLLGLAL